MNLAQKDESLQCLSDFYSKILLRISLSFYQSSRRPFPRNLFLVVTWGLRFDGVNLTRNALTRPFKTYQPSQEDRNPCLYQTQYLKSSFRKKHITQIMESAELDPTSALAVSASDLPPLEQDVLDEYERLAENMKKVPNPKYQGPSKWPDKHIPILLIPLCANIAR